MRDCETWFGKLVECICSEKYHDTWDVWERRKYISGVSGAPCTVELKVAPRLLFQRPTDVHVFGYTADAPDVDRATRLRETYPELSIKTPLIECGLTKAACLAMLNNIGIRIPALYELGFHNNNCIPCCKATSPDYWALVRKHFPQQFERMAKLSRSLNARLTRLGHDRAFIDEIPDDWPTTLPVTPACDFLCHIAEQDLHHPHQE